MRGPAVLSRRTRRRAVRLLAVVAVALSGAGAGLMVGGSVTRTAGPLTLRLSLHPGLTGGVLVDVGPVGTVRLPVSGGPLSVQVSPEQVDVPAARARIGQHANLDALTTQVEPPLRAAVIALAVKAVLCALAGAVLLALLVFRAWRPVLVAAGVAVFAMLAAGAAVALSWKPAAVREPQFSGLLADAPQAVGEVEHLRSRFEGYVHTVVGIVTRSSTLFEGGTALPEPGKHTIRVLHVSDIHDNPEAFGVIASVVSRFHIDVIADTGDLSDHGTSVENQLYAPIARLGVPYVYLRGNHDSASTEHAVAAFPNTIVLHGEQVHTVAGLRFFGGPDPVFTPDNSVPTRTAQHKLILAAGRRLAARLDQRQPPPVDITMIHDPYEAGPMWGHTSLILAGHLHHRETKTEHGTLLLVGGSTGGAGLRALDTNPPTPVELSVLYFDRDSHQLLAYDEITIGGLGATTVTIQRHTLPTPGPAGPTPIPGQTPGPSQTPTTPPASLPTEPSTRPS